MSDQAIQDELTKKLHEAAKPLLQYLNDNCHPHMSIVVNHNSVEVLEGVVMVRDDSFLKD